MSNVRVSNVTYTYPRAEMPVLFEVSLTLGTGISALVGVNGAGKTTLLRCMATDLLPTSGQIELGDGRSWPSRNRARVASIRTAVGYCPQEVQLPQDIRVGDFLTYMGWLRSIPHRQRREASLQAADRVGLVDRIGDRIGSLSGGMRRRLTVAQAIIHDPDILILDEPMVGLDPEQRIYFRDLLVQIASSSDVLISSHNLGELSQISEQVVMLDNGRIIFDDSLDKFEALGRETLGPGTSLPAYEAAFLRLRGETEVGA